MKKPKAPKLVTVAVTTTITIIFWIFFTLYQVLTTKAPPSIDPTLLEPIDASLDTDALNSLNGKVYFEEGSFAPPAITSPEEELLTEPSPTPSETPTSSPTENPEETPTLAPASESEV